MFTSKTAYEVEAKNYTRVTLENESGVYIVQNNMIEMDIDEIMVLLIRPVLLAAGYHPDNLDNYIE